MIQNKSLFKKPCWGEGVDYNDIQPVPDELAKTSTLVTYMTKI